MSEEQLDGGHVSPVVRIGHTVRRVPSPRRSEFVHAVLNFLHQHKWPGAPRYLGLDALGRETLDFLEGYVPWEAPHPDVASDMSLILVSRLVRQFHDLTANSPLAGVQEVVCHNDLSPKNTVYRDSGQGLRPVAFIDWDMAAPGRRIHDVAHMCWQYLDLGPGISDASDAGRRVRLICDAYGLDERGQIVDEILAWQDRCWKGIESTAAEGDLAMGRLRDAGVPMAIQLVSAWVSEHRLAIETRL